MRGDEKKGGRLMPDTGLISVPLFILVILAELLISSREQLGLHGVRDSVNNILLGIVLLLTGLVFKYISLELFLVVHDYRLINFNSSTMEWIAALVLCDLVYYLFHRLGHECRIFWAYHSVHHSSAYYNYTVGIRNHFLHITFRYVYWAPLCWLGIDPYLVIFVDNCTNIYQFMLHTRLIGKLGPLEYILNTPSHHRVHHASNEMYLDKNYGGLFILYDRLFGTFCEEREEPVFGITKNVPDSNLFNILFIEFIAIFRELKNRRRRALQALVFLFGKPGK